MIASDQPLTNQTHFAQEEPLFESPVVFKDPSEEHEQKTHFLKSKKGMLAIFFVFFLFFLLILILMSGNRVEETIVDEDEVNDTVMVELTPLEERLQLLQRNLEIADPAKHELPFPPVDMDIRINNPED